MKKRSILLSLLLLISIHLQSQVIRGKVFDSTTNLPLEYASIGVINSAIGTVTNSDGVFSIDVTGKPANAIVRISMISYQGQEFTVKELSLHTANIMLLPVSEQLAEVSVSPSGKERKVGTSDYTMLGGFCGWGGIHRGKGSEVGTEIKLGSSLVALKSLHIRLSKQSFDSSLFRLHVRSIVDSLPHAELLKENVLIVVDKKSGWVDIDLSKYNILVSDDIALTLEWVNVIGINEKKQSIVEGHKGLNVLFNISRKEGCTFTKWGVEDVWKRYNSASPSFYLTIQE